MLSQLKEKFENIKENFNAGSTIGIGLLVLVIILIISFAGSYLVSNSKHK